MEIATREAISPLVRLENALHPWVGFVIMPIFALANGYLGIRGTFEESVPAVNGGTFVNGFYESWPIVYGEQAYGFAKTGQTIVNATDTKIIKLYVDDEPFWLPNAQGYRPLNCACEQSRAGFGPKAEPARGERGRRRSA